MKDYYSLIILGGGVAGYTAALLAAKNGMRVALFERDSLGGTCLNRGCIPTKTLLHSAELFASRESWAEMGILAENIRLDENAIFARKNAIVGKLRDSLLSLVKANRIDFFPHEAVFADANSVTADGKTYSAENILTATGALPARLKIPGIELTINSYRVLHAPLPPEQKTLLIVGGGAIGVEFATYFASTGRSVTILEAESRILPMMDEELSAELAAVLRKKGVTLRTSVMVESFRQEEKLQTVFRSHESENTETLPADAILIGIGRQANIRNLNLEKARIHADRNIPVNEKMHTGVAGIYAAGDVLGGIQLAHYAAATATVAVETMLGRSPSVDLNTVPACIYTTPEIASVGLTEAECAARNLEIEIGKTLMSRNGKSLVSGTDVGYIKTLVSKKTGQLLGATAFCIRATDIISELSLAISKNLTRDDILRAIHAHPTVAEGIFESLKNCPKGAEQGSQG